jgi:hypothetical protein
VLLPQAEIPLLQFNSPSRDSCSGRGLGIEKEETV